MGQIYALLIAFGIITSSGGITLDIKTEYRFTTSGVDTIRGSDSDYYINQNTITKSGLTVYRWEGSTIYDSSGVAVFDKRGDGLYEMATGVSYRVTSYTITKNGQVILNLR